MKSIEEIPATYTSQSGIMFVKERKLSLQDYYRMLKKLHWNSFDARDYLIQALLEKDTQRLQRIIKRYVESESEKYDSCALFIKTPITVQELVNFNYIISFRIFTELHIGDTSEEK